MYIFFNIEFPYLCACGMLTKLPIQINRKEISFAKKNNLKYLHRNIERVFEQFFGLVRHDNFQ